MEITMLSRSFDNKSCDYLCNYHKNGISKSSNDLLDQLVKYNIKNKTLLDLGCGIGVFSFECIKKGLKKV